MQYVTLRIFCNSEGLGEGAKALDYEGNSNVWIEAK